MPVMTNTEPTPIYDALRKQTVFRKSYDIEQSYNYQRWDYKEAEARLAPSIAKAVQSKTFKNRTPRKTAKDPSE